MSIFVAPAVWRGQYGGMNSKHIGMAVRRVRSRRRIEQRELAQLAGLTQPTLSEMEAGKVRWTVERIDQVATALGMTTLALVMSAASIERAA